MSDISLNNEIPSFIVESAKEFLQSKIPGIDPKELILESAAAQIWRNGALGCPKSGHVYTMVIIPGYKLVFQIGEQHFTVHTDLKATQFASPNL